MDNLRAAAGWALDAPDVDDAAVGVAILGGLAGEALYRPSSGILAWATAGVARCDELDAAHRPLLLGVAAYDASRLGDIERAATLDGRAIAESETFTQALVAAFTAVSASALAGGMLPGRWPPWPGAARLDTSGSPMPNSGSAMNYDEIVAYALDKLDRLTTP